MNIVREFKESDFKDIRRSYFDEEDPVKLLKKLEEIDSKDFIEKSKIIQQLIYKCPHVYPKAKYPDHPIFQEYVEMEYCGLSVDCDEDFYNEYLKLSKGKKEGEEGYDPSLFCSICGLDIKKLVHIRTHIEWMEHCSYVEGW